MCLQKQVFKTAIRTKQTKAIDQATKREGIPILFRNGLFDPGNVFLFLRKDINE